MKVKKRVRGREVVEGQSTNSERQDESNREKDERIEEEALRRAILLAMRKERGKREERPKALRRRKV